MSFQPFHGLLKDFFRPIRHLTRHNNQEGVSSAESQPGVIRGAVTQPRWFPAPGSAGSQSGVGVGWGVVHALVCLLLQRRLAAALMRDELAPRPHRNHLPPNTRTLPSAPRTSMYGAKGRGV